MPPDSSRFALEFRDLQPIDLPYLEWSGGPAHQRVLEESLEASWLGDVVVLVAETPDGLLVACGGLDLREEPPRLWMLAVDPAWQSLGIGTRLVSALSSRAKAAGAKSVALTVEEDNPRAKTLYVRLGFSTVGSVIETWPTDDGRTYVACCDLMVRYLR